MGDPNLIFTEPIVNGSGAAKNQNCSVELLGKAIYGDMRFGYDLPCIDEPAQRVVVGINDAISVEAKQTRRWRLLVARLGTCHRTGNERLRLRMALWSARSVEHLSSNPAVKACNDTLERYLAGEATIGEVCKARAAASAAAAYSASAAAYSAYSVDSVDSASYAAADSASAAAYSAYSAYSVDSASYAAVDSASAAAYSAYSAAENARMEWLDRYLTAWHKTAADEGCLIPDETEAEYLAFVEQLDYLTGADA